MTKDMAKYRKGKTKSIEGVPFVVESSTAVVDESNNNQKTMINKGKKRQQINCYVISH